jgi:hypothetical protein
MRSGALWPNGIRRPANLLLAFRPHHVLGLVSADIPFRDFRVF